MSTGPTTRRMGRVQAYLASHPAADFAPEFRPPRPATPRRKKDEQGENSPPPSRSRSACRRRPGGSG